MKGRVLIIEDEKRLSEVMSLYLKKEGYEVDAAFDGNEGERLIEECEYDIVILDIMMPYKDGWSLLRKLKSNNDTPVILTTARGEEEDRVFGLELGADDYMVKPISMRELVLRVNLRIKSRVIKDEIKFDNIIINEANREVIEEGRLIQLTPKEFDLFLFMCKNPNQVFKREHLLNKIWEYEFMGDSRTVDTHVKNIREKIKFCLQHLKTVWGVGYKMEI